MSGQGPEVPGPVGVVGLGLVGGSLARCLKEDTRAPEIVASSLDGRALERAVDEGIVDRAAEDAAEVAGSARIVVYATPLDATLELLDAHRDLWSPEAVLTDVVSLKEPVARKIGEVGAESRWVGGHPMAGSEASGFEASRPDLFRGALIHLVRGEARADAAREVEALWRRTGARVHWIEAEEHDRRMVWASHLPQLLANALAAALARAGIEAGELGPGGRDMTRLAASSPELWRGLLDAAGAEEGEPLREAGRELERIRAWLEEGRIERVVEYMEGTRAWKEGDS